MTKKRKVYTDGGSRGNPGIGAWGAVIFDEEEDAIEISGTEEMTTNNRMELTAAIKAMENIADDATVEMHTDSVYVQKGITEWIVGWKARGWKTSAKKPVLNQDLWKELDALVEGRKISWHWVKGHNGDMGNERADAICNEAMDTLVA